MNACIECGRMPSLVTGAEIYPRRPDLHAKPFWKCACGAYCGCHPGTLEPLGSPAGPETRAARSEAHAAFDPLWRDGEMRRPEAYAWLARATGIPREECHIGMMDIARAQLVRDVASKRRGPPDWVRSLT